MMELFEDEIVSIEYYDEIDTVDITVEDTHMFFANDIYTHNSGFDVEFIEAHHTGGSIKRVQKAHFFMSVGKTPDQKEAGLANIRIIKARFAHDGQSFTDCTFDNDKMEIIIHDESGKYSKVSKELKKHDSKDIDKLENKVKKLNEMSSDIRMHEAISRAKEDSVNDELLFKNLLTTYNEEFGKELINENILITNDLPLTINTIEEVDNVLQNEPEEIIEREGEIIASNTVNHEITGRESELDRLIENNSKISLETPFEPKSRYSGEILNTNELEKNLIDPDDVQLEHISVYEILKQARSSQGKIKKE